METENTIPIVVGITGHRAIREQDRPAIAAAVRGELEKLRALCPHAPLVMLSSLAEGGDLLCADVAEELGLTLIAALPRDRADYERDFSPAALTRFAHHCDRAQQVFVAPDTERAPVGGDDRDFQFRQAGIYVAAHCHVLLALWDGGAGTAAACGTAEAVDFALRGSFRPVSGPALPAYGKAVIHIFTPRGEHTELAAGTVRILGDREAALDILRKTEDFDRKAAALALGEDFDLPDDAGADPTLERMARVRRAAGKLSRQAAQRYRRVLALLAAASALLTFAFLMYDEARAVWMILVCGAMLLAAWGCRRYAVRSDCHRSYLEFRALAECLRVQTWLRYAGSRVQAADLLSWTQKEETAWVSAALDAMSVGAAPELRRDIRVCWVQAQRDYHRQAEKRSRKRLDASDRTVGTALFLSVALYLAGLGYELLCGGLIFRPVAAVADVEFWRTVLKILMGTLSAVTLFAANYYGRLSLPRGLSDHRKMARFYETIAGRLETDGQTEALLTVLAREELTENGNWCSYQRDNKPDVSL